ncbi:hypothetical protein [Nocardia tengchongensis]|uniref:hypothetical protein n=1 Tax=Nocardia tengchongensis TaxID=2055889 RepID=UPI0036B70C88
MSYRGSSLQFGHPEDRCRPPEEMPAELDVTLSSAVGRQLLPVVVVVLSGVPVHLGDGHVVPEVRISPWRVVHAAVEVGVGVAVQGSLERGDAFINIEGVLREGIPPRQD